jgi:hypothetical protein
MSLWHRPVGEITFENVDAFLREGLPEDIRLDYKVDISEPPPAKGPHPAGLEKLIAAFANTLGGLIILGVDADKKDNKPIWPPQGKGMPLASGIPDRVVQIVQANVYPTVPIQMSPVLENRHLPGHSVMVLRVDESPEAPHTINNGRRVYERVQGQNDFCDFADIGRIQHLLDRRADSEARRETNITSELERSMRQLSRPRWKAASLAGIALEIPPVETGPLHIPLRWASVIPLYPWRDLCEPEECFRRIRAWRRSEVPQRVPGGAFTFFAHYLCGERLLAGCYSLASKGHAFAVECAHEVVTETLSARVGNPPHAALRTDPSDWLSYEKTTGFAAELFDFAQEFYRQSGVEIPGLLHLSMGIVDALGYRMSSERGGGTGRAFIDTNFRAEAVVPCGEFLETEQPGEILFAELAYGFDMPLPKN